MGDFLDEETQEPLILVSPLNWMLFSCFVFVFLAGLLYACFVSLPIKVEAKGIVFNPDQTVGVYALHPGIIKNIFSYGGEEVKTGSPLIAFEDPKKTLRSEVSGEVVKIQVEVGKTIKEGDPILWIQKPLLSEEMQQVVGVLPVPMSEQIRLGMPVEVRLEGVDSTEYGHVIGKVASIVPIWSEEEEKRFPINRSVPRSKKSNHLALVVVDLLKDPHDPSQYLWTAKKRVSLPIQVGNPCRISVIVQKKKLISYLFKSKSVSRDGS
jgi:hypothetical protein